MSITITIVLFVAYLVAIGEGRSAELLLLSGVKRNLGLLDKYPSRASGPRKSSAKHSSIVLPVPPLSQLYLSIPLSLFYPYPPSLPPLLILSFPFHSLPTRARSSLPSTLPPYSQHSPWRSPVVERIFVQFTAKNLQIGLPGDIIFTVTGKLFF